MSADVRCLTVVQHGLVILVRSWYDHGTILIRSRSDTVYNKMRAFGTLMAKASSINVPKTQGWCLHQLRSCKLASKTKVNDFDFRIFLRPFVQQVLWLDVTMDDAVAMKESHRVDESLEDPSGLELGETRLPLDAF
jgi:hypothetical protein